MQHRCDVAPYILELLCRGDTPPLPAGGEPVEINAGDFVHFPAGQTTFKVTKPVRKFFTLLD